MRCSSIEALNKQLISLRLWQNWGPPPYPAVLNAHANSQSRSGAAVLGLNTVCCINIVINASQVEGNGECLCQFDFLTFRLSPLSSSSALILIIPVKLQTAPCTALRFSAAAYSLCHSPWQGRQEAQHSFIPHKGRPVQLDKYYFPPLTASPVKLVLYYFCSLFFSPTVSPHHHAPSAPLSGKGSVNAAIVEREDDFKSMD